ncbi:MAG: nucleoside deaminase [Rikenellaceae bacterium]|jgi:tRNA(adenine34) deaminase|nr:nucleoside deaminase [Rikenellaceae bacterium]
MDNEQNGDIFFMRQAIAQAQMALAQNEVPIGAVVVCGGRVVARAHNLVETLNDPTAHAEMQAITAATGAIGGKYLPECTLYVTVEPCPMCASAAYWAQLGRIVFGADDPKRGFTTCAHPLLHPKTRWSKGVLAEECAALMTDFFRSKRQ